MPPSTTSAQLPRPCNSSLRRPVRLQDSAPVQMESKTVSAHRRKSSSQSLLSRRSADLPSNSHWDSPNTHHAHAHRTNQPAHALPTISRMSRSLSPSPAANNKRPPPRLQFRCNHASAPQPKFNRTAKPQPPSNNTAHNNLLQLSSHSHAHSVRSYGSRIYNLNLSISVQGSGVQNAQYQGICSWMIDPLATDPQSRTHYLQCQPAPNNLFCGRWQRMPCAPGTVFDVQSQVCVWDTNSQPGTLPTPAPYVSTQAPQNAQCGCTGGVQIGSCNQNYQCPGQSVCQVGQNAGQQVRE